VFTFRLPDVGEGIAEAEIVRWLVEVGDHVTEDQPFVEIQTDKALVEMPAPASGTVTSLGGGEGDIVKVGEVLVVIDDGVVAAAAQARLTASATTTSTATATPSRPAATPATRHLARELGVDLHAVTGTGPGGRITDDDVLAAAEPPPPPTPTPTHRPTLRSVESVAAGVADDGDERVRMRGLRRRTAETMTASWRTVPHVNSFHEVDVTDLFELRERLARRAADHEVALTLTSFLVKATALALQDWPMMNATLDDAGQEIVVHARRNIGVAVNTPDGLVVPVVADADTKPLLVIARELQTVTAAARERSLDLASMQGGTFTVTNHGPLGGWFGTSLVRPGETGILGFGPAVDKPAVVDGEIAVRRLMVLNAAADHRVVDGHELIGFCVSVRRLLEDPLALLLEDG
jgi:pyruvate/2-oxoglutarate dehydrogenase complex dihydrolipoamide acyltransferase (E2) component